MIDGKIYEKDNGRIPIQDPYLIVGHHVDHYPEGDGEMGPKQHPVNWNVGNDFRSERGWNMYHGTKVPGFPAHPHKGFETITYARQGFIDHFDSDGNFGRYGNGDIQWMVSGKGFQHAEMFPLLNEDKGNDFEIVQIWLNLPKNMKLVDPSYKMHWRESLPVVPLSTTNPDHNYIKVLVGNYDGHQAPRPVSTSYAFNEEHHINIWDVKLEKDSIFKIPVFPKDVKVQVYVMSGELDAYNNTIKEQNLFVYQSDEEVELKALKDTEFMIFIGKEINEEVYAYGPFVMSTREEIIEAYKEYEATQFGGWPWDTSAPTIDKHEGRFSMTEKGKVRNEP